MKLEGFASGVALFAPASPDFPQCPYECIHGSRCYRIAHHPDVCETTCVKFGIVRFNGPRIWAIQKNDG